MIYKTQIFEQCLKWTVAHRLQVTNILFRLSKAAQYQVVTCATKKCLGDCLKDCKQCCFTETGHKLYLQRQVAPLFQSKTGCYEHTDWSKYIFVANEYTANVTYCSPHLFIFIEPINTRFHLNIQVFTTYQKGNVSFVSF